MNPCTLGWYLPLLVKDVPGALQPSDEDRYLPGPSSAAAPKPGFNALPRADTTRNGNSNGIIRARGTNGTSSDDQQYHNANPATARAATASADPRAPSVAGSSTKGRISDEQQQQQRGPRHAFGGGVSWKDLDAKFRRDLPDDVYVGRLAYRGLVMRACPSIRTLDGVEVSAKERDKAEQLLGSVLDSRKRPVHTQAHAPRA